MYDSEGGVTQSAPMSMMDTMYTTTFGNGNFILQPPVEGETGKAFPVIPYISIEAIFYQQQASNPISSPVYQMSGSHIGQQVISGQYTIQDSTQTSRYQMGYQGTQG